METCFWRNTTMEKLTTDKYVIGLTRIALGFVMFWAFIDKMFGLGFATAKENAKINGGKVTFGFLTFGTTESPLADFFANIAGKPGTEFLFLAGLCLIGLALILGIGTRIAGISGALLMMMMWLASLPLSNNPIIDDHIIYAFVFIYFAVYDKVGHYLGLGAKWAEITKNNPVLV
jgi:thiosulfate dehydrogenase [quinone] large subunit